MQNQGVQVHHCLEFLGLLLWWNSNLHFPEKIRKYIFRNSYSFFVKQIISRCKNTDWKLQPLGKVLQNYTTMLEFLRENSVKLIFSKDLYCKLIWRKKLHGSEFFVLPQHTKCGNYYGNSLSRIFGKNFVKVMVLLSKLLKSWFDKIFLWWERISHFSTLWRENNFK